MSIAGRAAGARDGVIAAVVILLVATCGLSFALQGWRSRVPDEEALVSIMQAVALVERHEIPNRATQTDLGPYFPPGTAWLVVPGVLAFDDVRLVEKVGSAALYLGSLVGVFLIGRRYFGLRVAILATLLYGLSPVPLLLAGHLWPRGHPFFYVWIVYLAGRWVDRRDGRYLAAAGLVWAAGMYVHLEHAPAFFIFPAVWWFYRPPVDWRALMVAGAVALVMWYPYLDFQWERGFIDVEAQLLLRPLEVDEADTAITACGEPEPARALRFGPARTGEPRSAGVVGAVRFLAVRLSTIADLIPSNIETRVMGGDFVLLCLLAGGIVTSASGGRRRRLWKPPVAESTIVATATVLAASVLVTEFALRWLAPPATPLAATLLAARRLHILLVPVAGLVLARNAGLERSGSPLPPNDGRLLVIALVVPWGILLLFGQDRMLGIWPLQAILIAAFVGACWEQLPASSIRRWVLPALVVAIITASPLAIGRARAWVRDGWAGTSAAQVDFRDFAHVRCWPNDGLP